MHLLHTENSELIHFANVYRIMIEWQKHCMMKLNGQLMEEVTEIKYLYIIMCMNGSMERETRKTELQGG